MQSGTAELMCPWDGYAPATVQFCEARLCSVIVEPANAWSNVGFIVVGAYLLVRAARLGKLPLTLIGVTSVLVGVGSFLFHMSGTLIGELIDVSTMLLIGGLMLSLELRRLIPLKTAWHTAAVYAGIVAAFEAVLLVFPVLGIALFSTQVALFVFAHLLCRFREKGTNYRYMRWLFWSFGLGFGIWVLDFSGAACDQNFHLFNGHAAWHLLTAVCMLFYFMHQSQFFVTPGKHGPSTS
ncbi:MAG: ceramidase domain-containing protein [Myxococcaceae bacterium]